MTRNYVSNYISIPDLECLKAHISLELNRSGVKIFLLCRTSWGPLDPRQEPLF